MPSLEQRLEAAERKKKEAQDLASELRKQIREKKRQEKREAEHRARLERQAHALDVLEWLEANTIGPVNTTVNAYDYIRNRMDGVRDTVAGVDVELLDYFGDN